jgi:hypothetical protein
MQVELSAKRCKKARSLSLRDFVNKMEFKRKCFLGHKPAIPKEGRVAARKRIQEGKANDPDSKDSVGAAKSDGDGKGDAEIGRSRKGTPYLTPVVLIRQNERYRIQQNSRHSLIFQIHFLFSLRYDALHLA